MRNIEAIVGVVSHRPAATDRLTQCCGRFLAAFEDDAALRAANSQAVDATGRGATTARSVDNAAAGCGDLGRTDAESCASAKANVDDKYHFRDGERQTTHCRSQPVANCS